MIRADLLLGLSVLALAAPALAEPPAFQPEQGPRAAAAALSHPPSDVSQRPPAAAAAPGPTLPSAEMPQTAAGTLGHWEYRNPGWVWVERPNRYTEGFGE